ncbi:MAG: hypothetical protein HYZ14_15165 [Bacteroidetes bacterium]|nr:hypothetical protein [Bacteroidota bacterium]
MNPGNEDIKLQGIFGAHFQDEKIAVSADVWAALSQKLDEKRSGQKRKRRVAFYLWAAGIAFLVTGTGMFFLVQNYSTETNLSTVSNVNGMHELSKPACKALRNDGSGIWAESTGTSELTRSAETGSGDRFNIQQPVSAQNTGEQKQDSETISPEPAPEKNEVRQQLVLTNLASSTDFSDGPVNTLPGSKITPLKLNFTDPVLPAVTVVKPSVENSNWSISVYAGMGHRRYIGEYGSLPENINAKMLSEKHPGRQFYSQTGIAAGYRFNKNITLGFGVQTGLWNYRSGQFLKRVGYSGSDYEFDSPVGQLSTKSAELSPYYSSPSDTVLFRISMSQTIRFVSVPLNLRLSVGTEKLNPYLKVGVTTHATLSQDTKMRFVNAGVEREIEVEKIDGLKKFHFSAGFAIGTAFKATPKIAVFGELQADIPITQVYKPTSAYFQKINTRGMGFNVGVSYLF